MTIQVKEKVNLANFTTFGIGGEADFFCRAKNKEELIEALDLAKEKKLPYYVIGGGSNLLISDSGVRGLIILNRGGNYKIQNEKVIAESGANLSTIARETVQSGYAGLDFATGIPGTIGGAVIGNAGAYGKDMSKVVLAGEVWDDGKIKEYLIDDFEYVYRASRLKGDSSKVLLEVSIKLERGDREQMLANSNNDTAKRVSDYSGRNSGSYFCNIEESILTDEQKARLDKFITHGKVAVGKVIESLGLKGFRVGDAMISENHANVVLNLGNAKAKDVLDLEKAVTSKVLNSYGIILRPEVTKLGEF